MPSLRFGRYSTAVSYDPALGLVAPGWDLAAERAAASLSGGALSPLAELIAILTDEVQLQPLEQLLAEYEAAQPVSRIKREELRNLRSPLALSAAAQSDDKERQRRIARSSYTHPITLERLALDYLAQPRGRAELGSAIANNPRTPPSTLARLASAIHEDVRADVAGNPNTPPTVLDRLAESDDENTLVSACLNPSTPAATLIHLAGPQSPAQVRRRLADNPSAPATALALLAVDPDPDLRRHAASHSALAEASMEQLVTDQEIGVRRALACNPNLPVHLQEKLAQDHHSVVAELAGNPSLAAHLFPQLAIHFDPDVRLRTLWNPSAPPSQHSLLASDRILALRQLSKIAFGPDGPTIAPAQEPGVSL